jgi:hypothetical protein
LSRDNKGFETRTLSPVGYAGTQPDQNLPCDMVLTGVRERLCVQSVTGNHSGGKNGRLTVTIQEHLEEDSVL